MAEFVTQIERLLQVCREYVVTLGVIAGLFALATTPLAFGLLSRQEWFQARRGRTLQRPSFAATVVAMMLVMGIPAIFCLLAMKSEFYDQRRYEYDPGQARGPSLAEAAAPGAPSAPAAAAKVEATASRPATAAAEGPVHGISEAAKTAELASVPQAQRTVAELLPLTTVPQGWVLSELGERHLETFHAENLYEKINGRAESFLQYQVKGMAYASYHPTDTEDDVQLYIFEFPNALNALGKYGSEKPADAQLVDIGSEGYEAAGSVAFYERGFFVQVVSSSDEPRYAEFSKTIARQVSQLIKGEKPRLDAAAPAAPAVAASAPGSKPAIDASDPTALFKLLPDQPKRLQQQYVAQDVFGYSFLSNVFLADYKEGDDTWQGFLRPYESAEAAKTVFDEYVRSSKADGAQIEEIEVAGADRFLVSSNIGLIDVLFLRGNVVAGANGATRREPAEAFAREFVKNLPEGISAVAVDQGGAPAATAEPGPSGEE
jgi:hypothetical protein